MVQNQVARRDNLDPQHKGNVPGSSDIRIPVCDQKLGGRGRLVRIQVSGEEWREGGEVDEGRGKSLREAKRKSGQAHEGGWTAIANTLLRWFEIGRDEEAFVP